jgi:hypothetical protein
VCVARIFDLGRSAGSDIAKDKDSMIAAAFDSGQKFTGNAGGSSHLPFARFCPFRRR